MQATTSNKLRITLEDVNSPQVDAKLKERDMVLRTSEHYETAQLPTATASRPRFEFLYNTLVYMGLFGLLGGLLGWSFGEIMHFRPNPRVEALELIQAESDIRASVADKRLHDAEAQLGLKELARTGRHNPYFAIHSDASLSSAERNDRWEALSAQDRWKDLLADILFFSASGIMIAVCLAAAESIVERNWQRALINSSVGAIVGLAGGIVIALFADKLYTLLAGSLASGHDNTFGKMIARSLTWGAMGLFLGAAPGVVLRHWKKLLVGMLGGLAGGLAGGLLFDAVDRLSGSNHHLSRLVAIVAIGVLTGIATGMIENAMKSGWFKVTAGLIAGKQFVLYRNPTYIGSSPQSHIYLFKDGRVGRRHAAVHITPAGHEIEDLPLGSRTFVNGKPVTRARLRSGDRVQIGGSVFQFMEKEKTAR